MQTATATSRRRIIDLGYRPREQFVDFHRRRERWSCLVAHRRAGKTVACVMDLIHRALKCEAQDGRFAYVAPYWNQAKDVAWLYVKRFTAPIPGIRLNESELYVEFEHNKARVRLAGADNYDRLRGAYLDGCILDEYGDMHPAAWPEVIRPMLSDRKGWATFIGTPKGRNDFHSKWEESNTAPGWFSLMLRGSESGLLDDEELADLRRALTPEQYEQEIECNFNAAILGAYYGKEIVDAERGGRIAAVEIEPSLPVHTAWDLGIGDSTAIWCFQVAGKEVRFVDFIESHGQPLGYYAAELKSRGYHGDDWVPHDAKVRELSTGRTRIETLQQLQRKPRLVPDHKIEDGINAARVSFPALWFDATRCKYGLEALRQYRTEYDEKAKVFSNRPKHDWCFVGDTKILTRNGTCLIKDLPKKGEVLTRCGWKDYVNPRVTRRSAPLVEVAFEDGLTVKCTPDHLFATENGWTSAEFLTPGTLIQSSLTPLRNTSTGGFIGSGQKSVTFREAGKNCIVTFGQALLEKYRKAATSIIETIIPPTIHWLTWNAYQPISTYPKLGTEASGPRGHPMLTLRTLQEKVRLLGIGRKLEGSGIGGTPSALKAGPSGSTKTCLAKTAERSLQCWFERAGTLRSFVPTTARPLTIASVKHLTEFGDVWCLTVPDAEEFSLVNGAVVHNCSHAADAFRYATMAWKELKPKTEIIKPTNHVLEVGSDGRIRSNMSVRDIIEMNRRRRAVNE